MGSFYGGPKGNDLFIKKVFPTKTAMIEYSGNDLYHGDYVLVSYGYNNVDGSYNSGAYQRDLETDNLKNDGSLQTPLQDYNATLWQFEPPENFVSVGKIGTTGPKGDIGGKISSINFIENLNWKNKKGDLLSYSEINSFLYQNITATISNEEDKNKIRSNSKDGDIIFTELKDKDQNDNKGNKIVLFIQRISFENNGLNGVLLFYIEKGLPGVGYTGEVEPSFNETNKTFQFKLKKTDGNFSKDITFPIFGLSQNEKNSNKLTQTLTTNDGKIQTGEELSLPFLVPDANREISRVTGTNKIKIPLTLSTETNNPLSIEVPTYEITSVTSVPSSASNKTVELKFSKGDIPVEGTVEVPISITEVISTPISSEDKKEEIGNSFQFSRKDKDDKTIKVGAPVKIYNDIIDSIESADISSKNEQTIVQLHKKRYNEDQKSMQRSLIGSFSIPDGRSIKAVADKGDQKKRQSSLYFYYDKEKTQPINEANPIIIPHGKNVREIQEKDIEVTQAGIKITLHNVDDESLGSFTIPNGSLNEKTEGKSFNKQGQNYTKVTFYVNNIENNNSPIALSSIDFPNLTVYPELANNEDEVKKIFTDHPDFNILVPANITASNGIESYLYFRPINIANLSKSRIPVKSNHLYWEDF